MRRGFCATLLVVGCAILPLRGVSLAQIKFIPGTQRTVPNGPQFAAAADFNNDGLADAVVSNGVARKITILFGSSDGTFQSAVDRLVGNLLRGVATADFNGDRNNDIVVADFGLSRAFVLAGNGDGTLNPTGNFTVDRRGPYAVATGNFDNKNGPDIVTANSFANSITTLFNLGRNSGFSSQPNISIGKNPRAIGTADFNSDGLDDIAVLNTGGTGTDQIAILLNNGLGSFQSSAPTNFVVGKGAKALTINDFNDDGIPDIAVLNGTAIAQARFSISILLNETEVGADNKPVGTGFFTVEQGAELTCPARINLTPVNCTPQDIKSADFDGDGLNDLVVSVSTRATDTNSVTAGFVSAFQGRGDGTFDFGTQVLIGRGPRQMAIGDFTGDGGPDVFVTETTDASVRILRTVFPPRRNNGDPCGLGTQCLSTFCVDHVCCGTPSCPASQSCDIPGHAGQCHMRNPNGDPCNTADDCQSNFCVDGSCCDTPACPSGLFCNRGTCNEPSDPGERCTNGQQCRLGFCVDEVCCSTESCPAGQRCDIAGAKGFCTSPGGPGTPCTQPDQCQSGSCVDQVCCLATSCPAGQVCNAPGHGGVCTLAPTPTRTATPTPTPQPTGAACTSGGQCQSGNCVNNVCCGSASCPSGQRCDIFDAPGACTAPKGPGGECRTDTDCTTGNCAAGSPPRCGNAKTATPTRTPTPHPRGGPCSTTSQCEDGYVCSTDERVCCTSLSCPSGQSCAVASNPGNCTTLPTPTRTPSPGPTPIPIGGPCDPNNPDACETGLCTNNVCCDSDSCLDPERCDIFNFEGTCAPPLLEGDECE